MIQSAHAHLRRLGSEKGQLEEEARKTHEILKQKYRHLISQRKYPVHLYSLIAVLCTTLLDYFENLVLATRFFQF